MPSKFTKHGRHKQSLFDPRIYAPPIGGSDGALEELNHLATSKDLSEAEICIFRSLLCEEEPFIPSTGVAGIAGPLVWEDDGDTIDLSKQGAGLIPLPRWVEPDGLRFKKCTAKGILVVEKQTVLGRIAKSRSWQPFDLLLVGNSGFPQVQTRRFIHRVAKEFGLPVFVLADNDTWGYFMFSVLKRGTVLPHRDFRYTACSDVRYLGFRAGDAEHLGLNRQYLIAWDDFWKVRLKAMAEYRCFKAASWRKEFAAFRKQNGKFELECAPIWHDGLQTQQYLDFALRRKDQLM